MKHGPYPVSPGVGMWLYISAPGRPCLLGPMNIHSMTVLCDGALQVAPLAPNPHMRHLTGISLFPARPPLQVRTNVIRVGV